MGELPREIRAGFARLGKRGRTTRIPDDIRAMAVGYARAQRRRDVSWRKIASEARLSASALKRWADEERPRRVGAAVVVPVRVRAERQKERPITLVAPSGIRVEGLSLDDAVRVLRLLA